MRIAVIPARGGSKRVPRKNLRFFAGRPMIAWPIDAALRSNVLDRVIVSTDDAEIAEVARNFGAEAPFLRPASLADDHTGTMSVVQHALEALGLDGASTGEALCLYATAAAVTAEMIAAALSRLAADDVDYVFAAQAYPHPIERALRVDCEGRATMLQPEHRSTRTQDLQPAYHDAGQFYWGRMGAWLRATPLFSPRSIAFPVSRASVVDIDTEEDWRMAELIFGALRCDAAGSERPR